MNEQPTTYPATMYSPSLPKKFASLMSVFVLQCPMNLSLKSLEASRQYYKTNLIIIKSFEHLLIYLHVPYLINRNEIFLLVPLFE